MNESYIKLFRKFKEWEWYDDINTKVLFLHLLLSVNYKDKKWKGQEIKKGEIITSLNHLAEETHLTKQQIRTSLSRLKSTQEITYKTTHSYTHITIVNWRKYQCCEENITQQITHKSTNEQHSDNTAITLTKERKKERKEENNIYRYVEEAFARTLNPIEYEEISSWEDNELTRYAIKQAVLNNVYRIKYISSILNRYKRDNIKTVVEAEERDINFNSSKTSVKKSNQEKIQEYLERRKNERERI